MKRPSALTAMLGNPGHRTKNHYEPKPKPITDTAPPDHLSDVAKEEWNRLATELLELGLFTNFDKTLFALYCAAFSDFLHYSNVLKEEGEIYKTNGGIWSPRPEVGLRRHAFSQIKSCCESFGFSPSARARMSVTLDSKQKAPTLEEILAAKGNDS